MRDRTAVLMGALAGALAGGVAGWLWLGDDGERVRTRLEPRLHELAVQAIALGTAARRVQAAARDSARTARQVASRTSAR